MEAVSPPYRSVEHLAVLGYGYWGPNQVRNFCALLGEERVVVAEPNPAQRALAAERHPGVHLVGDISSLMHDGEVQAVCLCTPAGVHAAQARQFLEVGRHVLVEKPLATSSGDGLALARLAQERGLVLMASHTFLFHPAARALRQLIQSGELGELCYVTAIRSSLGPRVRSEVSVVWDYLIHDAYLLPYLLDRTPLAVRADGGCWLRPGLPDAAFVTLEFGDGALAHIQSSWFYPVKRRRMVVVGSRKMAVWDEDAAAKLVVHDCGFASHGGADRWGNQDLWLYDNGATPVPLEWIEPIRAQCQEFLSSVEGGREPLSSGSRAVETLRLLEAIDASLASNGQRVVVAQKDQPEHVAPRRA